MDIDGLLQTAVSNFENSASRLGLSSSIFESLFSPKERIECCINPILSNGRQFSVKSYLVRHNDVLGPSKGGIRMSGNVTLDDITGLAMEMTWKTALIGVPFGGGKSGICCDGLTLSPGDKEIVLRSFTRGMCRHIGPGIYIPAPDMGTNEADMGHIKDCIAYSKGVSITDGCYVTGKPIVLGGILGRREATGTGVAYCIKAACNKCGFDLQGARIVVQGFGNVGSVAAGVLRKMGAKIVAVSDVTGALLNYDGINIDRLLEYTAVSGEIKGFDSAQSINPCEIFELPCEVLVPAAAQSQITQKNADAIKARIVAEGANAPTTPQGDEILNDKKVFVIPDILCNAGGVFVSYLEYAQETQREQMTLKEVQSRLIRRITEKFENVVNYSEYKKISMRSAATDTAVKTVAEGLLSRGFYP